MPPSALGIGLGLQFVSQSGTDNQLSLFVVMLEGKLLVLNGTLLTT
jgi:hypothetical protein